MSDEPRGPLHRWGRRVLILVVVLVIAAAIGRAALPGVVRARLVGLLAEQLNIDLDIGGIDIDLRGGHVTLDDVRAELDGAPLAHCRRVEAELDVAALLRGEGGTIALVFEGLEGELRLVEGGGLNLARIGPRIPSDAPDDAGDEASARIVLDIVARDAHIRYRDAVTDPGAPLELAFTHVDITATRIRVAGPDAGAELLDVRVIGVLHQEVGPALLSAGMWEGTREAEQYLEAHAALTAFDVRTVPQYVTPRAGTILGGDILHVAGTAVAHDGTIDSGLVEVEVEGARSDLEMRFGGPLDAPVFDMDSPVLEAFRLSYLRVVDSGASVLDLGRGFGESLWDRSSGFVSEMAGGVGSAVSQLSLRKLGEGIWNGIEGLFSGGDDPDERAEEWAEFARRQLAFRELFVRRRIEVAEEMEPERVDEFEALLRSAGWRHDLEALMAEPDAE